MKMAKRILIGVLALALMISCVAFVATAQDKNFNGVGYADILEYYNEPVVFDYDFTDADAYPVGDFTGNYYRANTRQSVPKIVTADDGSQYLQITGGNALTAANLFLYWNAETLASGSLDAIDDFFLEYTVSGTGVSGIYVSDTAAADANGYGTALLKMNFNAGAIQYYDSATDSEATLTDAEGNTVAISASVKYDVSISYSVVNGKYSFSVTESDTATLVAEAEVTGIPYSTIGNVMMGAQKAEHQGSKVMNVYSLSAAGGSFVRDEANKLADTEEALLYMHENFMNDAIADDYRFQIAKVLAELQSYDEFNSLEFGDEARAALDELVPACVSFYSEQLEECLALAKDDMTYEDRMNNWLAYGQYKTAIPVGEELEALVGAELAARISQVVAAYDAEGERLELYKTNSESFVAALAGADATSDDYAYLSGVYNEASKYAEYAYAGCEGVAEAQAVYEDIADKVELMNEYGAPFVEYTLIAADGTLKLNERYDAYLIAKTNLPEVENFPGIETFYTESATYTEAKAAYDAVALYMETANAVCTEFISDVNSANFSQYFTAKNAFLAQATASLEDVQGEYADFDGVAAALELYEAVSADIAAQQAAAKAYMDAVAAIEGKTGDELEAAIAAAEALKATGDIQGVPGITDANIALSNAKAEIELVVGRNNRFIALVAAIEDAQSKSEVYDAIFAAKAAAVNADDSFDGVADAKITLEAAVATYNLEVMAANNVFAQVSGNAVSFASSAVNSEAAQRVSNFIKSLFD